MTYFKTESSKLRRRFPTCIFHQYSKVGYFQIYTEIRNRKTLLSLIHLILSDIILRNEKEVRI